MCYPGLTLAFPGLPYVPQAACSTSAGGGGGLGGAGTGWFRSSSGNAARQGTLQRRKSRFYVAGSTRQCVRDFKKSCGKNDETTLAS